MFVTKSLSNSLQYVCAVGLTIFGALTGTFAVAEEDAGTMIIFDFSSSMNEAVRDGTKIDVAKRALGTVLDDLSNNDKLGLALFGAGTSSDRCQDVQIAVTPQRNNLNRIRSIVGSTYPIGGTPLSQAIHEAAQHMDYRRKAATLVLISDGLETCNFDPCATAAKLQSEGLDLKIHMIGFGLTNQEENKVKCIAQRGGGEFYSAGSAATLVAALTQSLQKSTVGDGIGAALKRWRSTTH